MFSRSYATLDLHGYTNLWTLQLWQQNYTNKFFLWKKLLNSCYQKLQVYDLIMQLTPLSSVQLTMIFTSKFQSYYSRNINIMQCSNHACLQHIDGYVCGQICTFLWMYHFAFFSNIVTSKWLHALLQLFSLVCHFCIS